ncbi:peroxiredoxin family protein [Nubsella zeaxanthinifaciens]|uniref:peroxiredoxin family protein n=1 Tax=Nubsella zeaxanthinifaciens TaxID=392412 RepID=UPI001300A490|nr:redoxin domain-containing protein [Nubsella zeaxanthinifaciens]
MTEKAEKFSYELPFFSFYSLNEEQYSPNQLPKKEYLLILYFSPDCHYCTDEMDDIIKHKQWFANCYILLVSPSTVQQLNAYHQHLANKGINYQILSDSKYQFPNYFGPANIPTGFLYANNKTLIKKFNGGTTAKNIYSFINAK